MKQQPLLGFCFAMITAMAWGSLPIALKQVLSAMDAQTIVWYRFWVASLVLFLLLAYRRNLPSFSRGANMLGLIVVGVFGLAGNFFLFNSSLNFIEPSVAQIFIHFSSFGMLICGVFVFKERLGLHQKIGLGLLVFGLGLFFNDKFDIFRQGGDYLLGVVISCTASLVWVAYGMAQKLLLRRFSAQQILLMIYFGCALVFTPAASSAQVQGLDPFAVGCFLYCCANTLFGYGAYAEALNRWEVSKVSVVITLVPLFTIFFAHLAHYCAPARFAVPQLNGLSYLGALIVVCGAIFSAIGQQFLRDR
ncbi:DMT family transporter [uncultured Haemophilus sp.]|uniref:DMT family transporter n=1 Tax=uncultured Haemophilus sp. TaxID=237779 RepID=UPI002805C109|nr:DMT family transporter [uncultured Haemophilus sp.]